MSDTMNPLQPVTDLQLMDPPEVATEKDLLIKALHDLGVLTVQVDYNGYGDEGCVETITAVTADNREIDLVPHKITPPDSILPVTLHDAVKEFTWTAGQYFHCGFHNNEGGSGTVTIHVDTGRVKIEHNDNVVETVFTQNEF